MIEVVRDAQGRRIYLTDERWRHIIDIHPECEALRCKEQEARSRELNAKSKEKRAKRF